MKSVTDLKSGALFVAVLALAGAANAQEARAPSAIAADDASPTETEIVSLEDLESMAGGAGVETAIITEQTLNALNQGNKIIADTVTSGDIRLGANAFSGFEGIGNFVVNTGHNNNLQSSMNVSILLGQ